MNLILNGQSLISGSGGGGGAGIQPITKEEYFTYTYTSELFINTMLDFYVTLEKNTTGCRVWFTGTIGLVPYDGPCIIVEDSYTPALTLPILTLVIRIESYSIRILCPKYRTASTSTPFSSIKMVGTIYVNYL